MKTIQYLSPSGIALYKKNKEDFYLRYLSDNRPEDAPQTNAMAVGSSFDAYAKSYLHEALFGRDFDPKYNLITLFEAQVQPHVRDEAWEAGRKVFEVYKKSGALGDLLLDLQGAIGTPRFEFDVKGVINGYRESVTLETNGVTFMGKPDVFFINKNGAHVILDWKVSGYYSNYTTSPLQGYVRCRDEYGMNLGPHKNAILANVDGMIINSGDFLDTLNSDWALQLSVYSWLLGAPIGSKFICVIHQICCKPDIRVAEHVMKVSPTFQWRQFALCQQIWETCFGNPFHFFQENSLEESQKKCALLDNVAKSMISNGSAADEFLKKVCR